MSNSHIISVDGLNTMSSCDHIYCCVPVSIPHDENNNTAIVQCVIKHNGTIVSDFGVATSTTSGTTDTAKLLDDARDNAMKHVEAGNSSQQQPTNTAHIADIFDVPATQITKQHPNAGGGTKKASESQRNLIEKLCLQMNIPPSQIASKVCSKNYSDLTGADANNIIKHCNSALKR